MNELDIKQLTLSFLKETPVGENLERIVPILERVQTAVYALDNNSDSEELRKLKIGTVLLLSVMKKAKAGKAPQKFTKDDWADIANDVSAFAIELDSRDYTAGVFRLYSAWIGQTSKQLIGRVPLRRTNAIQGLAEELNHKIEQLASEEITEVAFVDDCLWISLDAAVKILSAYLSVPMIPEVGELIHSAANAAFEYGRLMLLKKEQRLLTEFIENQYALDAELEEKFEVFKAELQADADQFNHLIENAFSPDFRDELISSVELARAAGVDEEEILDTQEKIDSFFLD